MVFVDLEKAYDSIPRHTIRESLEAKGVLRSHIEAIRDLYNGASTNIQTPVGITSLFQSDGNEQVDAQDVTVGGDVVTSMKKFNNLGLVIQSNGVIDRDVTHRIQAGWLKWRAATGVLCDRKFPIRLKGKFYRCAIRPALLYGTECWPLKKIHEQKMKVAVMRMLRWMCGNTIMDIINNKEFREKLGVAPLSEKMCENRLRWFGNVQRKILDSPVRRIESIIVEGKSFRGRPKKTWVEQIKNDLSELSLSADLTRDMNSWRRQIHILDYHQSR